MDIHYCVYVHNSCIIHRLQYILYYIQIIYRLYTDYIQIIYRLYYIISYYIIHYTYTLYHIILYIKHTLIRAIPAKLMEHWKEIPVKTSEVELATAENVALHHG